MQGRNTQSVGKYDNYGPLKSFLGFHDIPEQTCGWFRLNLQQFIPECSIYAAGLPNSKHTLYTALRHALKNSSVDSF